MPIASEHSTTERSASQRSTLTVEVFRCMCLVVAVAIITQKRHIYSNVKIETKENSRIHLRDQIHSVFNFILAK